MGAKHKPWHGEHRKKKHGEGKRISPYRPAEMDKRIKSLRTDRHDKTDDDDRDYDFQMED